MSFLEILSHLARRRLQLLWLLIVFWTAGPAGAQAPQAATLVHQMLGTWDVQEWMWPGPGTRATSLPSAVAERRPVGDYFLQEVMTTPAGAKDVFSRYSCFGFNPVNRQYEYFSLDSRAPQMMSEHSTDAGPGSANKLNLLGGMFVAPQWGELKNATFRYRLVLGPILDDRQEVDLYLTPISGGGQPEFLAFKYLYTRHR